MRYLLFCHEDYYPQGGWDDFKGDFEELEVALKAAATHLSDTKQIVDTQGDPRVVWEMYRGKEI